MKVLQVCLCLILALPAYAQWRGFGSTPSFPQSSNSPCIPRPESAQDPEKLPNPEFTATGLLFDHKQSIPEKVRQAFYKSIVGVKGVFQNKPEIHGTGFVVENDERGIFVITDMHIVAEVTCIFLNWEYALKNPKVFVYADGHIFEAQIVNSAKDFDLVLLKINADRRHVFHKKAVRFSNELFTESGGPYYAFAVYENEKARGVALPKLIRYGLPDEAFNVQEVTIRGFGVLDGLVHPGFSGGCIFDKEGNCGGVTEAYAPDDAYTDFTPISRVLELMKATRDAKPPD